MIYAEACIQPIAKYLYYKICSVAMSLIIWTVNKNYQNATSSLYFDMNVVQ